MKTVHKAKVVHLISGNKEETVRFRIDPITKQHWGESFERLGVKDFSSYARRAVERAIQQDFRAADPKWQAFLEASKDLAIKYLGYALGDEKKDYSRLKEIEDLKLELGSKMAREKGLRSEDVSPLPGQGTTLSHVVVREKHTPHGAYRFKRPKLKAAYRTAPKKK